MSEYTLEIQIAAVKREIALRERTYPRFVANAKMKGDKAAFEICAMKAVLTTLEDLKRDVECDSEPSDWRCPP